MRAILFDLGDTLFRLDPMDDAGIRAAFAQLLVERGLAADSASLELAAGALGAVEEALAAARRTGSVMEPSVANMVAPFLSRFGGHAETLASALDRLCGEADTARWVQTPEREQHLAKFAGAGLELAFVSNTLTHPDLMRARLTEFGLLPLAKVHVFSVAVGERKPSPAIYRAALDGLGISPEDAIFVGDRVREDVVGPQSLGMRGVLTHEFRQEDLGEAQPHGVIRSIPELWDLLD